MKLLNKLNEQTPVKILAVFLAVHFIVWVLVPLLRPTIPMDSVEAIVWGSEWSLGTNKHPFLGGWLAEFFYLIFQNPALSVYILTQVCVVAGLIYIYKLGRLFLSSDKALLSVLFLEGTIYYSICSVEYNVNVLSLAIVPMMAYYFYLAIEKCRLTLWILTGALMGAALMTKYTNGIFLIAMGLYLLMTKTGRGEFKKPGMYVAGGVCLTICLPHIWWLVKHDFFPFEYLLARASGETPSFMVSHFVWPLKFAFAQGVAMALTLMGFVVLWIKGRKSLKISIRKMPAFLGIMGLVPLVIWILISALAGVKLKSMWGFAFVYMIPMILFYAVDFKLDERLKKIGIYLAYGMMLIMALGCAAAAVGHTSLRTNFPGREFAADMQHRWNETYQTPLKYTGGDIWFTSLLYVYLPEQPRVLIQMNPKASPWIDVEDVKRHGAVVMADNMDEYLAFQSRVAGVPDAQIVPYKVKSLFGKEKTVMIHFGILPPADVHELYSAPETLKKEEGK